MTPSPQIARLVETPLAAALKAHHPGKKFRSDYLKKAGKILKDQGVEAAMAHLDGKDQAEPPNFKPPAKCRIVARSREFSEWPIVKASVEIQKYIYGLTLEERKACDPGKSSASHKAWFAKTGVNTFGYSSVQGFNLIFGHTLGRYDGVLVKTENLNKKRAEKNERFRAKALAEGRAEPVCPPLVTATNDTGQDVTLEDGRVVRPGQLLQPPGINPNIYAYQQVSPKAYVPGIIELPEEFQGYSRDPNAVILPLVPRDRLSIPKGQPGYVPEPHREGLTGRKDRRMRRYYETERGTKLKRPPLTAKGRADKANEALLVVVRIDSDWVVMDVRGLLRNARWRRLVSKEGITLNGLLDLFTGDPVLNPKDCSVSRDTGDPVNDPRHGVVTFCYKLGVVDVCSKDRPIKGFRTKEVLERLTSSGTVGMVSIDLGQTNPVAAAVSRVTKGLQAETLETFTLPDDLLGKVRAYRAKTDRMEEGFRRNALRKLTAEQQAEITRYNDATEQQAKALVCSTYGIGPEEVPWERMTSNTTYISDHILDHGGDPDTVFFMATKRGQNKPTLHKRKDKAWGQKFRPAISVETRLARQAAEWELRRASLEFQKLSVWKTELCRQAVNYVMERTKKRTQCDVIIPVIEDLPVPLFHGSGKRDPGWANFFVHKRENRWFIDGLHKAFSELGKHRGIYVFEVCPQRTSITCPKCGHCDPDNRDGEKFVCLSCQATLHADLDVATTNLVRVALTGKVMPRSERSGDAQTPGPARKARTGKIKGSKPTSAPQGATQTDAKAHLSQTGV